ncbi:hypothetical protein MWH30_06360 [Fuchsiella alkaliacetigena]|nr:hypothetical protein [Fuchsiella alkaliacetigena]
MSEKEFKNLISKENLPSIYSKNDIIRSIVELIPIAGPIIDGFLAKAGTKFREKRMNMFLVLLYKSLHSIKNSLDKKGFDQKLKWTETEEFHDMLNIALDSTLKTRSREKIIMNVMVLTNIISVDNDGKFRPEEYLYSLELLSPLELKVIYIFYKCYQNDINKTNNENELQKSTRLNPKEQVINKLYIDEQDLIFLLKRIEKSGFLKEITGSMWGYSGGEFTITESLNRMMKYISKHPFSHFAI